MLTDIFAHRYVAVPIWSTFTEPSRRLIAQGFQLAGQIVPYYDASGNVSEYGKSFWKQVHDLLARELGLKELSPSYTGFYNPQNQWVGFSNSAYAMCEKWMLQTFDGSTPADAFIKERLSLVEIAFRKRGEEIATTNRELPATIESYKRFAGMPGFSEQAVRAGNTAMNALFDSAIAELNTRFRQSGSNLHYHNGFVQIATDEITTNQIAEPFWILVADPKWKNVDHDMKEALDLRDSGGRDPAFYAAKALESTIKIISDDKHLTTGKEKGAANYIDNIKRGNIVDAWEVDTLKAFFSTLRNPFSHGPGSAEMPNLSAHQNNWAIENCMSWIKSLILRSY